jgi:hypothetical protein
MLLGLCAGLALCFVRCSSIPGANDGGFGGGSGAGGGGGGLSQFQTFDLDKNTERIGYIAAAFDPASERVGIAYLVQVDAYNNGTAGSDKAADGGNSANWEVRYVEWKQGVTSPPQVVRVVQRTIGVSVAFQGNGEPAVSYLGGGSDMSIYWLQSDAVVSFRSGGTTWTESVAMQRSDDFACPATPPAPTEIGFLVGVWPSLVFDGNTALLAFRDNHNGQFPQQDWAASDVKITEGGAGGWTRDCVAFCGNNKKAYGGRINMIMAAGQPALIYDSALGGADTPGNNILFQRRNPDKSWTSPQVLLSIANTQSGGSIAYDKEEGFGVVAIEHSGDTLQYTSSQRLPDGGADLAQWNTATQIFGSGSGGWYPSLAMDPIYHEPAVAFYLCSKRGGVADGTCPPAEDELKVMQRISGTWREALVDSEGGYLPKIGFFASGKRVIAYRLPKNGNVRLAVEH